MKKRIWELDAFRGICVLGMVAVHLIFDLVDLYKIVAWDYPVWFSFLKRWGGVLFFLVSGISATLGSRSVRRGLLVLLAGLGITAVTYAMYRFGLANSGIIIYFGVLQCLGVCMILWPLFRKSPWWALSLFGIGIIALGFWMELQPPLDIHYLMPLGLPGEGFSSADYFPLFPYLGFFLLGASVGRTLYSKKQTLLPNVNDKSFLLRFLQFAGRHSLEIYLLHQPVINGLCILLTIRQ